MFMLKRMIRNAAGSLGGIALLWRDSLKYGFRRPSEFGAVVAQMDEIGVLHNHPSRKANVKPTTDN